MNDPVTCLPNISDVRGRVLRQSGIHTVGQVLSYTGVPVPGVNLDSLRKVARAHVNAAATVKGTSTSTTTSTTTTNVWSTSRHSWYGFVAHVLVPSRWGRVQRVRITDAVYDSTQGATGLALRVQWHRRNEKVVRLVSPLLVAATHTSWIASSVVSDTSDDETTLELHTPAIDRTLPEWVLYNQAPPAGGAWMIAQVNLWLRLYGLIPGSTTQATEEDDTYQQQLQLQLQQQQQPRVGTGRILPFSAAQPQSMAFAYEDL